MHKERQQRSGFGSEGIGNKQRPYRGCHRATCFVAHARYDWVTCRLPKIRDAGQSGEAARRTGLLSLEDEGCLQERNATQGRVVGKKSVTKTSGQRRQQAFLIT